MTKRDPRPLKSDGGTPAELVRALDALGGDRDTARLARAAERLSATLSTSGAPPAGGITGAGVKVALAVVLGLAAAGAMIGYMMRGEQPPRAPDTRSAPAAPVTPEVPPQQPEAAPPPERLEAGERNGASTTQPLDDVSPPAPSKGARAPRGDPARTVAPEPRRVAAAKPGGGSAAKPGGIAAARPGSAVESTRGSDNEREGPGAQTAEPSLERAPTPASETVQAESPPPAAPDAGAPKPSPAQPAKLSEVALMREARRLAAGEPEAALRLLDQHERRFPKGLLVPERELLAIEVLRRLGRETEAEQRMQRFRARYPESMHRRRLEERGEE